MLLEDYEMQMQGFKLVGMLTNPEGYKQIEEFKNKGHFAQEVSRTQLFKDGIEATKELEQLGLTKTKKEDSGDGIAEIE